VGDSRGTIDHVMMPAKAACTEWPGEAAILA
jgi:hypothetical protein